MTRVLNQLRPISLGALATLILGFAVNGSEKAWATDQATNLGVVSIDCTDLTDRQISYSGGEGDYFFLISSAGTCTFTDADGRVTGEESGDLLAGVARKITIVSAGTFTVTGDQARTFTIVAHPVFANQAAPPVTQVVELSCRGTSSSYISQVVFFAGVGDTFRIRNDSGSGSCTLTDTNNILTGEPASIGTDSTSPLITIDQAGTFTLQSSTAGAPAITINLVQDSTRGDATLGANATTSTTLNYTDVFFSGGNTFDATVTVDSIDNLEEDIIVALDENINPEDPNWGLSPRIDAAGFPDAVGSNDGSATFTVAFQQNGNPVTLSNVSVTLIDIDRAQFISAVDVESFTLSSDPVTALTASRVGNVLTVRDAGDVASNDTDQDHWVVLNFGDVSSMTFTVGAVNGRGASFGLVFTMAPWSNEPATTDSSSVPDSGATPQSRDDDDVPSAIALALNATPNQPLSSASAFIEGQGLRVSSPYTLQLGPSGRVLYSGIVGDSGRFDHTVGLFTGLAPGQYFVELRATAEDGSLLVLTQAFTVGAGGIITFVGPSVPGSAGGSGLANTGVDASMMMLGGLSLLLLLAGMASVAASRLRSRVSA